MTSGKIEALKKALAEAQRKLKLSIAALSPKHVGGEWEAFHKAEREAGVAERALAEAERRPYAEVLDFDLTWDRGAPMPHLLRSESKTLLIFYCSEAYHPVPVPGQSLVGVVEFHRCTSAKFGSPNDEVFHGHPLSGSGLRPYTAMEVIKSPWIDELQAINSVHERYSPAAWKSKHHYVLGFHDSTFECVAGGFMTSIRSESMSEVLRDCLEQIMED